MTAPDRLGHYRILGALGVGAMGEVVRAHDTKLDREVALKLVPPEFLADADRHARFHREARSMAAFNHPHVAAIHALEEQDGRHFLVMELVEGEDLAQMLNRGPLPVTRALDIARQMALGLEAAHAAGIVHRDLKPANVKLTPEGRVKLLDFGLAKVFEDRGEPGLDDPTLTSSRTLEGVVLGTAAYMSPEQARGRPVDRRTDIWALGVVLYEMLTGHRPFRGETVTDTLAAVVRQEPDWRALPAGLPAAAVRLIHRCLRKDAHRRLHDVADARLVLEEILEGDGPPGAGDPDGAAPRARPRTAAVALLALAAAALGLLAGTRLERTAPPEPPREEILTYSGRDWAPDASPDGSLIVFASDRDGTSRIWLKQLAGGGERPLTEGTDDLPRFSPDGSQVLFVRDLGTRRDLFRVPTLGGDPRKIVADVTEGDWAPDGDRVAFLRDLAEDGQNVSRVGIASLQSGDERLIYRTVNRLVYAVRWSPDGRWIAVNESSLTGNAAAEAGILLLDPADGSVHELHVTDDPSPYSAVAWNPAGDAVVVGQAPDLLAHVMGRPGLILESGLDPPRPRPLAWVPLRLPRGGWGYSTLAVLDRRRLVTDQSLTRAELHEVDLGGDAGGGGRALTRGLGRDRQPAFSPDGGTVIFSSNRSGNVDLWLLDRATGELRQHTDDDASDWDPAFTPDGSRILWSSDRSGNMEIWMSARDGTGARQVSRDGKDAENPTMTPDGAWIVYASGGEAKIGIWKIRPDGTDATRLTEAPHLLPEVSPDGRYVLMLIVRSLNYLIEVYDLAEDRMTDFRIEVAVARRNEDVVYGRARWLPDGRGIAYIGQDASGRSGIYVQDFAPQGGTLASRRVVAGFAPHYATESLGVAPDGRSLVFSATYDQRSLRLLDGLDLRSWR